MFRDDLEEAELIERRVAEGLNNLGYKNTRKIEGYHKEYDLVCDPITFEVKHDKLSTSTGNFFFEYECNGKKSGIACTDAYYFILVKKDWAYMVKTDILKAFLRQFFNDSYKKEMCGDGGRVKGIVVPTEYITPQYLEGLQMFQI